MGRESKDDDTEFLGAEATAQSDEETVIDTPALDKTEVAGAVERAEANVLGRGRQLETREVKPERRVPVGVMAVVTLVACVSVATVYVLHRDPGGDIAAPPVEVMPTQSEVQTLVDRALSAGQIETLPAQIIGLLGPQPQSEGFSLLLRESTRLADMYALMQRGQVQRAAGMRSSGPFATASLEQAAVEQIDPLLDTPERLEILATAAGAWQQGELIEALNAVRRLARQPDATAAALLQHYSSVVEAYDGIRRTGVENVAVETLLGFYLDLDPVEDAFFWRNMKADLLVRDDAAANPALAWLEEAGQRWIEYSEQGGIDGALRQQPESGAGFRQRAQALSDAADNLARVVASASARQPTAELAGLRFPALVNSELAYQIRSLEILLRYSDDALWQSRLDLLPRTN